jgi:hypothetical protein
LFIFVVRSISLSIRFGFDVLTRVVYFRGCPLYIMRCVLVMECHVGHVLPECAANLLLCHCVCVGSSGVCEWKVGRAFVVRGATCACS